MVALVVCDATEEDFFEDKIKVHSAYRPKSDAGHVIVVVANGKKVRGIARGTSKGEIFLNGKARRKLSLKLNESAEIEIKHGNYIDDLIWAWNANNTMPRIAARLAVLSVVLGLFGLLLGFISIMK